MFGIVFGNKKYHTNVLIVKLISITLTYIARIYENEFEELYGMSYK